MNGFFAGAEVALVSVRRSRLRQMAAEGAPGAQAALGLLSNPGRLLSVIQAGVTLASLGLGWAGEETLFQILNAVLHRSGAPRALKLAEGVTLAVSFMAISYLHVVLGEVVPKNLALEKADRLAALVAPPLLLFYRVTLPFVVVMERSAEAISRLAGLKRQHEGGGHSAEELKLIVSSSRGMGFVPEHQEEMIHRVLDLDRVSVREVMVPRKDIVSIPADASDPGPGALDGYRAAALPFPGIRRPARADHRDPSPQGPVAGLGGAVPGGPAGRPSRVFHLRRLLRPYPVVPETKPLSQTLDEFQQGRSHMALVVDEFGTIVGLVTVEDVLEQIVGPISDDYDEERARPHARASAELELDGATRIRHLENEFAIELPTDAGFETLAGFLLYRLGKIPAPGAAVEDGGRRYTVVEMDRNRISRVRIENLAPEAAPGEM